MVAPCFQCTLVILLLAVTCDGNNDQRSGQLLAEPGSHLIAVEAGQTEIEQQILRLLPTGNLDGLGSVTGDLHLVPEFSQPQGHRLGRIAVVIDDKDFGHTNLPIGGEQSRPRRS